jgi:uncharacterized protein (TIGR00255 family)
MTGAATFVLEAPAGRLEAEARSVNHRFLKATVRTHGSLPGATAVVEDALRQAVRRGHVTVHLRLRPAPSAETGARVDQDAFATAARHLARLAREHGLAEVRVADVLALPGVLAEDQAGADEQAVAAALAEAVGGVVAELQAAREREGALLAAEVRALLDDIETTARALEQRAGEVPAAFQARLAKRMEDLLQGTGVAPDPAWLARECAVLAERSDVREEIARVAAHVAHARDLLAGGGPIGRRLEFLAQELHREANTVGSKANDLDLSRRVLDLRAGVERLREQVQNLE